LIKVFGQDVHSPEQSSIAQRVARNLQINRSSTYIAQLIERRMRSSFHAQSTGMTLRTPIPHAGITADGKMRGNGEGKVLWAHDLLLTKACSRTATPIVRTRTSYLFLPTDRMKDEYREVSAWQAR